MTDVNFYSLVRYVPDPATDEALNIGIIAFGESIPPVARFVRNWKRAEHFGDGDTAFLREFADAFPDEGMNQLEFVGLAGENAIDANSIREWSKRWINSIQLSEPKASMLSVQEILEELGTRLLREHESIPRASRDRRVPIRKARESFAQSLVRIGRDPDKLLKTKINIQGALEPHSFDLGLANGLPLLAIAGLSFEGQGHHMKSEVEATAYRLGDVRSKQADLPLAVVTLPPPNPSKLYQRASRLFGELETEMVEEDEIGSWAAATVRSLLSQH